MSNSDEFLTWCGNLFDEPPEGLSLDTPREDIPGWDSMGTLLLMADLDEVHGIQLSEDDLTELKTLRDILNIIEAKSAA